MPNSEKQPSVFLFVLIMCLICGGILAALNTSLKERHVKNEILFNKKAVLKSVENYLPSTVKDMDDSEVEAVFNNISQLVVDYEGNEVSTERIVSSGYIGGKAENVEMKKEEKKPLEERLFPVYIFKSPEGTSVYICSIRGNGLWDKIWASIAVLDDFNTISGVSFDHQGETPGLGAEIKDNAKFSAQFKGKKLYDSNNKYVSVAVRKGGARESNIDHEIDAITGATITCDGVSKMLFSGMKFYEPYFESQK